MLNEFEIKKIIKDSLQELKDKLEELEKRVSEIEKKQ